MVVALAAPGSIADQKSRLRAQLRQRRQEQGCSVGSDASQKAAAAVADAALSLPELIGARSVAVYAARGRELDPSVLAQRLPQTVVVSYPRVEQREPPLLSFRAVSPSSLKASGFNLLEPSADAPLAPPIDVFVVPGLGFDRAGRRLGQGGGYYDAAMRASPRAIRVGVGYDFQLISEIPVEDFDEPLDYIVTPTQKLATLARACKSASAKEDQS